MRSLGLLLLAGVMVAVLFGCSGGDGSADTQPYIKAKPAGEKANIPHLGMGGGGPAKGAPAAATN
jgi:hypothetical protein